MKIVFQNMLSEATEGGVHKEENSSSKSAVAKNLTFQKWKVSQNKIAMMN